MNSVEFVLILPILMNMSFDGYFPRIIGRLNIEFSNQINVEFLCLLYFDDCHLSVSSFKSEKKIVFENRQIGLRDWK